jgi:HK97 family phage major capsid protein
MGDEHAHAQSRDREFITIRHPSDIAMRKVKDSAGMPLLPEGGDSKILGFPVCVNLDMAAPGVSAKSLAFGWFGGYQIRDAMEMTAFRMTDSAYAKLGQIGFLAWMRSGGTLADTKSISLYQHSASYR